MVKTLAKFGLAKFLPVQLQRIAPGLHEVRLSKATHANDNLPGFRRPKDQRRIPSPALVCHWFNRNGRLECRWRSEPSGAAPISDHDQHGAMGRASDLSPMQPRGHRLALAG